MSSHKKTGGCCRRHAKQKTLTNLEKAKSTFTKGKPKAILQAPVYLFYRLKDSGYWGAKFGKIN